MKHSRNDEELEELLKSLGRNEEQIEAIKDFGKLSKALDSSEQEFDETVKELEHKYNIHKPKDCFGCYDDGDPECGQCKNGDACFEKGVV